MDKRLPPGLLQQSGAEALEPQLREWLAFDIQLNAQGLQYWQQKISSAQQQ